MRIFKKGILAVTLIASLTGCKDRETIVYQQAPQPAPVYINNPDPMTGVLAGVALGTLISDGHGGHVRYDGHNGYYDRRYHGPSRTVVKNTTIINKTVVNNVNNRSNPSVNNLPSPVAPVVTPVAANVTKVKNPGDAAVDAQLAQKAKQDQLKADLRAKQEARASGAVARPSGFNQMSKKSSTGTSYTAKSYTSGISSTKSGRR